MSDERIDRLIDQAADITQQVIANRDKRIAELSDEVSRLNSIVDKQSEELTERQQMVDHLNGIIAKGFKASLDPETLEMVTAFCERLVINQRVLRDAGCMARELEAWRRRTESDRGVFCSAECFGQCPGCRSQQAVRDARKSTDAAIPDLSVYTKEQS